MSRQTIEDITKLPKWAQDKIKYLEMRNAEKDEKIDKLLNNSPSRVFMPYYGRNLPDLTPFYLPDEQTFRFVLGQSGFDHIDIKIDDRRKCLVIMGGDSVIVKPSASNVVYMQLEERES